MDFDNLGFCLIRKDLLKKEDLTFIYNKYKLFDISISQINNYPPDKVLSVQSIFYGSNITSCSLVRSDEEFSSLLIVFQEICQKVKLAGMESLIFGSPILRKNKTVSDDRIYERLIKLNDICVMNNLKLYYEALSINMSEILNTHEELINLNCGKIHFDSATWINNNRIIKDLEPLIPQIERFHLSIPGYGTDFWKYPQLKKIFKIFRENKIKGTIEIQSFNNNVNAIKEIHSFITKQ